MEKHPDWDGRHLAGSWEKVYDTAKPFEEEREVDIAGGIKTVL